MPGPADGARDSGVQRDPAVAPEWPDALSAYERALLEAHEREIDTDVSFSFAFPADLGSLPPELAPRAHELLEFAQAVEQGVAAAMAKVRDELGTVARATRGRGHGAPPAPRYIDTSG